MLKKIIGVTILTMILISPSLAFAKEMPDGKWWKNSRISERLKLNEEEITKLDNEFNDNNRKLIQLKSNLETEKLELEILFEKISVNTDAIIEQYKKLEQARTELNVQRFRFLVFTRETLGYERFQDMKNLSAWRRQQKTKQK